MLDYGLKLKSKILLTGASGFIGSTLVKTLRNSNYNLIEAIRYKGDVSAESHCQLIRTINKETNWSTALENVDVVIHLAARVHVMNDSATDSLSEFRKVNVAGTLNLAEQAANAGVKRFIFLSTIKVNGERTQKGSKFRETDPPAPKDPYAISKWEAEQGLLAVAEKTGMEVVIIRPPLVYGPGVKANFRSLVKWVKIGVPLPLGAVHNKRSFVALDNLVSFIILCIEHPRAANEVFLISDDEDVSTTELLQKIAQALGKQSFLLPVPVVLMTFVAGLMGKNDVADRLFGSLQVDCSKARELLGWKPVVSMDDGLKGITQRCKKDKT